MYPVIEGDPVSILVVDAPPDADGEEVNGPGNELRTGVPGREAVPDTDTQSKPLQGGEIEGDTTLMAFTLGLLGSVVGIAATETPLVLDPRGNVMLPVTEIQSRPEQLTDGIVVVGLTTIKLVVAVCVSVGEVEYPFEYDGSGRDPDVVTEIQRVPLHGCVGPPMEVDPPVPVPILVDGLGTLGDTGGTVGPLMGKLGDSVMHKNPLQETDEVVPVYGAEDPTLATGLPGEYEGNNVGAVIVEVTHTKPLQDVEISVTGIGGLLNVVVENVEEEVVATSLGSSVLVIVVSSVRVLVGTVTVVTRGIRDVEITVNPVVETSIQRRPEHGNEALGGTVPGGAGVFGGTLPPVVLGTETGGAGFPVLGVDGGG